MIPSKENTWTGTFLPQGKDAVLCKVVRKLDMDERGRVARYKARVVAKGYSQKDRVDYEETFASVTLFVVLLFIVGDGISLG